MDVDNSPEAQEIVSKMESIRILINAFGLKLHGFDPGVAAYNKDSNELLNFGHAEWEWLKPILIECLVRRISTPLTDEELEKLRTDVLK